MDYITLTGVKDTTYLIPKASFRYAERAKDGPTKVYTTIEEGTGWLILFVTDVPNYIREKLNE